MGHGLKRNSPVSDTDSDISEEDNFQLQQQGKEFVETEGPWQLTPLHLGRSTTRGQGMLSSFSNSLFSPAAERDRAEQQNTNVPADSEQSLRGFGPEQSESLPYTQEGAGQDASTLQEMVAALQARMATLEANSTSHQMLGQENNSAVSATSPAAHPSSAISALVAELDSSLSDIQQICHEEPNSTSTIKTRLVQLRRLLHERAQRGLAVPAAGANRGDAAGLRAEMASLVDRLAGEMSEVREFVTTETSDVCAFVEERIQEALEEVAARQAQYVQQQQQRQQQQVDTSHPSEAARSQLTGGGPSGGGSGVGLLQQPGAGQLALTGSALSWSPAEPAGGHGLWSMASSVKDDGAAMSELPRNTQELWHYMQQGMQRVEGLRMHMEEHLEAVRTLCTFADDRIADVNSVHERFEERVQDLHASHRELERKLARLHSEQARSAGHMQALSAVAASLPRAPPSPTCAPASSADADGCAASDLTPPASVAGSVQAVGVLPWRVLLNVGVLLAIAALLAAIAFSNEPYLVAT